MNMKFLLKRKASLWLLAGAMGAGIPAFTPSMAHADDEPQKIAEAKVPAPVAGMARANYLDAHDVVYRKEGKHYNVNFTTPTNVRLQIVIAEDGAVVKDVHLAPTQPENAPKKAEREQIAAAWQQRAAQARATPVPPAVPVQPAAVPAAPPPVAGQLPQLPVTPVNTPIGARDVPPAVLQSFDRFTAGARDIRYYRQTIAGQTTTNYMADFTANDNSRREVVVSDNGSLVAGPLVMQDQADDAALQADKATEPGIPQPAQMAHIEQRDIPARVLATMNRYTERGTDLRYRRDTFADHTTGYTVHWVLADNGRRYWLTTREDGSLLIPPRLSSIQPSSTNDPEGVRSVAVRWQDVPDRVKQTLEPLTRTDRNAKYYKQVRDGKVSYGSEYAQGGKQMWVRVDEAGKTVAGPVAADTGKPAGDAGHEVVPAASKTPAATKTPAAPNTPAPAASSHGLPMSELPTAVQTSIKSHTNGGKNIETTKATEGGKTVYHVSWQDAQGDSHTMRVDEKGALVTSPSKK